MGTNNKFSSPNTDGDAARTLYSSLAGNGTIPLADPTGPARQTGATQAVPAAKILDMKDAWLNYTASTTATNAANMLNSDTLSYGARASASLPFDYFSTGMEGNFGSGVAGTSLDLFRAAPRTATGQTAAYEGTFKIDGSGNLTFNVIPEPTGAICLLFTGLAFGARRRRTS